MAGTTAGGFHFEKRRERRESKRQSIPPSVRLPLLRSDRLHRFVGLARLAADFWQMLHHSSGAKHYTHPEEKENRPARLVTMTGRAEFR